MQGPQPRQGYKIEDWYFSSTVEIPNDWTIVPFEDYITNGPSSGLYAPTECYGSNDKIVGLGEIFRSDVLDITRMKRVKLSQSQKQRYILKSNDLIFSRYSLTFEGVGKCLFIPEIHETILFESNTLRVSVDPRGVDSRYLAYYFNTGYGKSSIMRVLKQVSSTGITGSDLRQTRLILPSNKKEQQKIASILSNVDSLIRQTQKIIEQTRRLRKGLMQRLLTKGIGHSKFKEVNIGFRYMKEMIPEEWEITKLKGKTSKIGSGVTPLGGSQVYTKDGIPFIRSQNVHFDGLHLEDVAYISQKIHDEMTSTKLCPYDVLLNITGASIGRCTYVPEKFGQGNVNQHVCIIRSTDKLNSVFLAEFLSLPVMQKSNQ